jgi:hypothetical protein
MSPGWWFDRAEGIGVEVVFIANNNNVPREKTASDLAMPAIGISQVSTMVVCGKSFLLGFRTRSTTRNETPQRRDAS